MLFRSWADDGRIGPSVPGLGLTLAVELTDATGLDRLAFLHLPDRPSSLVTFTPDPSRGAHVHRSDAVGVMWAADVVLARLPRLLPGCTIRATHIFRLVREGDLVVSANETQPLAERVIDATRRRDTQSVVLLTLPSSMPSALVKQLTSVFDVEDRAILRDREVHDWSRLWDLTRLPRPDLRHEPFTPSRPDSLTDTCLFRAIRDRDHLLHHQYQSFDPVLDLVRAAAVDPRVERIATTQIGRAHV